jgi:hypothetical protein
MSLPALTDNLFTDAWLKEHATVIRLRGVGLVKDVIVIGERLIQAKERIRQHFPGRWLDWLKHGLKFSENTAERYMRLSRLAKSNTVTDLDVPLGALYLLASPRTPPTVVDDIASRAQAGDKITRKTVVAAIEGTKRRKAGRPPGSRNKQAEVAAKAAERDSKRKQKMDIWRHVRASLDNLDLLCTPADAVKLVREVPHAKGIVQERLSRGVHTWLMEFAKIWEETNNGYEPGKITETEGRRNCANDAG